MPDYFIGNAPKLADICSITITGTWLSNELIFPTFSGNGHVKEMTIKVGTPVTTADIAALIAAAWNATLPLSASTGSCNFGGQSAGEFAEVIAVANSNVVSFTTRNASDFGKPFLTWLTFTTNSASGVIGAVVAVQDATSPNFWNNNFNWSGNTIPGDTVPFDLHDCLVDLKYGWTGAGRHNIRHYNTHTGKIGLPPINIDNPNLPYAEYRPLGPTWDDGSSSAVSMWILGIGPGDGSTYMNLTYAGTGHDLTVIVHNTAARHSSDAPELIIDGGNHTSVETFAGRVLVKNPGALVSQSYVTAPDSDAITTVELGSANTAIKPTNGKMTVRGGAGSQTNSIDNQGAALTLEDIKFSICDVSATRGTTFPNFAGTVRQGYVQDGAILDLSQCTQNVIFTDMYLARAGTIRDPNGKLAITNAPLATYTNGADLWRDQTAA